jgi:stress response protein SCP2
LTSELVKKIENYRIGAGLFAIINIAITGIVSASGQEIAKPLPEDFETIAQILVCDFQSNKSSWNVNASKEGCDYTMQQVQHQCEDFELSSEVCAKDSKVYQMMQDYLVKYGLNKK